MGTEAKWSDFASLDAARTLAAANQLLPPWVALLLACAIAWQLAGIVWMLVPGTAAGDAVAIPAGQATTIQQSTGSADVDSIANAHIFGIADAEETPVAPVEEDENLEDTGLSNLQLRARLRHPSRRCRRRSLSTARTRRRFS